MAGPRFHATALSNEPITLDAHLAAVTDPACGAEAVFVGRVRDHAPDVTGVVVELQYSAHPDAAAVLDRIAGRTLADCDDAGPIRLSAAHRIGTLGVGEPAIVVAVSSAHRSTAFEVCREFVERVKAELPVWKRQLTTDGRSNWVGLP